MTTGTAVEASLELGAEEALGLSRRLLPYSPFPGLLIAAGSWTVAVGLRVPRSVVVPVVCVLLWVVVVGYLRKRTREANTDPDGLMRVHYRLTPEAIEITQQGTSIHQLWVNMASYTEENGLLRLNSSRGPSLRVLLHELPEDVASFLESQLGRHSVTASSQSSRIRFVGSALMLAIVALLAVIEMTGQRERGLSCDRLPGAVIFAEDATIYCD